VRIAKIKLQQEKPVFANRKNYLPQNTKNHPSAKLNSRKKLRATRYNKLRRFIQSTTGALSQNIKIAYYNFMTGITTQLYYSLKRCNPLIIFLVNSFCSNCAAALIENKKEITFLKYKKQTNPRERTIKLPSLEWLGLSNLEAQWGTV